ncbi:hypothetical protein C8J56DRAFT_953520 [Mycena floridula]|nr:hypothetical protein C8J56DRAFT_953520 [Mycena floridula]
MLVILDDLPNELTQEIISRCDTSTKAVLCRVSKVFQQLAQKSLYEIVDLDDTMAILLFDLDLRINLEYRARNLLGDISRILQKTTELYRLVIQNVKYLPDMERMTFPRLTILRMEGYECDHPAITQPFLNRHQTLLHLTARFYYSPQIKVSVDLPNLLLAVWLNIDHVDDLARFPLCQNVVIRFFKRPIPEIQSMLKRLKCDFPNIRCCMLHFSYYGDDELGQVAAFQCMLLEELVAFDQLESFGVVMPWLRDMPVPAHSQSTVESWLERCPTLKECFFLRKWQDSSGRYKVVDGHAQPTTEPRRMEKVFDFSL